MATRIAATFAGPQGSDLVARVMGALSARNCAVVDFSLSQSILDDLQLAVTFTTPLDAKDVVRELEEHAKATQSAIRYELDADERRRDSFGPNNRTKFSATLLNDNGLSAEVLQRWTALLSKFEIQIDRVERLNEGPVKVADFRLSVPTTVDLAEFRAQTFHLSVEQNTDIAIQPYDVYRKNKRLVVFDMDSTLIQQEVIDELAKHAGVVDKVSVRTMAI